MIMKPALYMLFWKRARLATGLWRWCLFLVKVIWNFYWLFMMEFI